MAISAIRDAMKEMKVTLAAMCAVALTIGCATAAEPLAGNTESPDYAVTVHEFEGCECNSVCPCIFSSDTTFGDCRAILVFTFNGKYGTTRLSDTSCVVVSTWAGKNMEANLGKWRGVLYTSDKGTSAEREAIKGLLQSMVGGAFASLESRTAPIRISRQGDVHELKLDKVSHLRIRTVKGQNGEVATILNAPSPLAFPTMHCAVAEVHSFDDGVSSWSFPGRNGFYADFQLSSAQQSTPEGR